MTVDLLCLCTCTFVVLADVHGETVTVRPNADPTLCLDVSGGVLTNGAAVQLWDCDNKPAQQWQFYADDTLRPASNPSFCLDSKTGVPASGAAASPLQLYACQGNSWSRQQ
jgi:hypothetical protein